MSERHGIDRRTRRRGAPAKVVATVRMRTFSVVSRAVEEGVAKGWFRAHKHCVTEGTPEHADAVREAIAHAVTAELLDVLVFDEEGR